MLLINPNAVPFALSADNNVPVSNRDDTFWDESGDVLLITADKKAVLFQKTLLCQYSETARSSLGHIEKQPQQDKSVPILELACNAAELRDVLEYLLLRKQYVLQSIRSERLFKITLKRRSQTQPTVDSLARYAFSAYTFCIDILDETALTSLLKCMRERLDTYAHWDGFGEFHPPSVKPDRTILASRTLPEPAKSMLPIAFVDGSIFGFDEASLYPQSDAPAPGFSRSHDEDTIALLRERNSELVDSLLKLCTNFDKRRSLSKVGRPCCNFEAFAAQNVPDTRVNAAGKGRSALSIIATLGAELEEARLQQDFVERGSREALLRPSEHDGAAGCLGCLEELHQGMMRLYGVWWEDTGRLLMGEPRSGPSAWGEVRDSFLIHQPTWWEKLWCLLFGTYLAIVGLLFQQ